jgi:hypothetical protein
MDWANNVIVASLDPKEGFHCCDGSHRMHVPVYVPIMHECCPCLSSVDFLFLILFVRFFVYFSTRHSEQVTRCMEIIMLFVIQESGDVHAELASCLLQNLKKETQVIPSLCCLH